MKDWTFDGTDEAAAVELRRRLPSRLVDTHAHLYRKADLAISDDYVFAKGPEEVGPEVWREHVGRHVGPERLSGALFVATPFSPLEQIDAANAWLLEVTASVPESKTLATVTPGMSPSQFEPLLAHANFAGFKPYHTYATTTPTWEAAPGDYIPEWAWSLAQEHGLLILLHLVRSRAMADPGNIKYVREHCEAYPGARLILAHAGRTFHAPHARLGVTALADLPNVWYDTAAICEAEPLETLLDAVGPRRLLWGTDFPVSEQRGRCVTVGDGFIWVGPDTLKMEAISPACRLLPVGLETLRALLTAADEVGLNEEDREAIFAGNARRLLGFEPATEHLTQERYREAKQRIPGGTQLLSKRPEMQAPDQWPAYFREARGCETWDLDGRHYYDLSTNGIGACLLGFRDSDVTRAVQRRIRFGSMCSLNPPEEVELADLLCELHPWAEQVRFARSGGEACAVAVRIARATTDRSVVAICGYSGWQDWYLAANLGEEDALRGHLLPGLSPLGVPRELRGTAVTFNFNSREELQAILDAHGERLAAVIMEPCRSQDPDPGFLEFVRDGAHRVGALLAFDEITIGWRLTLGGAHLRFGVTPDLAVFAKAMGNGHPMAAVIGTREAMAGAHDSFISSTYWTESVGPVAALASIRKLQTVDVPGHIARVGSRVQRCWEEAGQRHGLPVHVGGYPCLAHFRFEHEQAEALRTLYTQYMLDLGFLAGTGLYPTLAHTDAILDRYAEAIDRVFRRIAEALAAGEIAQRLRGPVAHVGFRRLTG
jgi:glutamate-1-semialdehyde 2,1-aminomutase